MPQYPLDMGKKDADKSSSTLAVSVNNQGGINYDAILKQGKNRDKLIASDHSAMVPKVDKVAGGVSTRKKSLSHQLHTCTAASAQHSVQFSSPGPVHASARLGFWTSPQLPVAGPLQAPPGCMMQTCIRVSLGSDNSRQPALNLGRQGLALIALYVPARI